jgi:hypothetical protein
VSVFPEPKGAPPDIEWLPCDALIVDPSYQRLTTVPASMRIVERIAQEWDWRLCSPLTVSHRTECEDPGYYVIDGQHRLLAAEWRGDIEALPCLVSTFDGVEDEARCFVSINTVRRMPSRLDKLHAECASGEAGAVALREVIEDAGLKLARTPGWQTWRPGDVAFVGAISSAIRQYGRTFVSAALVNIYEAFGGQVLTSGKALFEGLVLVHAKTVGDLDPDELVEVLKERHQKAWDVEMNSRRGLYPNAAEAMRWAILDAYAKRIDADLVEHAA